MAIYVDISSAVAGGMIAYAPMDEASGDTVDDILNATLGWNMAMTGAMKVSYPANI